MEGLRAQTRARNFVSSPLLAGAVACTKHNAHSLAGSVIITLRRLRLGLLAMRIGLRIGVWAAREGNIEVLDVGIHFNLLYTRQLLCNNDTVLFMRAAP